jgi:hypothetical protein
MYRTIKRLRSSETRQRHSVKLTQGGRFARALRAQQAERLPQTLFFSKRRAHGMAAAVVAAADLRHRSARRFPEDASEDQCAPSS